ncbi:MAG: branched-chain amino acid aminotransferase [Victivallales bacterium]|nr:branched-chain amino acid aminotransferase [Victivallales bacterium]MCF7889062.1 branched-chain amino acid aminotransferase [Victivallales bacterium]
MAQIDWGRLGFEYIKTNCHIEYTYKNGKWDDGKLVDNDTIEISIAANVLHYGQAVFEGLKAFSCADGKVRTFRDKDNASRMADSAKYVSMPEVPTALFQEAIDKVIKENIEYIPPYDTGGALYIRPFEFGSGPVMGVNPSDEYKFIVYVAPVGPYYKGGIKPVNAIILDDFDRTAPNGAGMYKLAGNYAAGMHSSKLAKEKGYPIVLFLDPKEHKYIDEFSTSNFIGISEEGKYVTPNSKSVLPSITNKSLIQLARDLGIEVEIRPIEFEEVKNFKEVGACGTAVVITPLSSITRNNLTLHFGEECGPVFMKLYSTLRDIQYGKISDIHNWNREII